MSASHSTRVRFAFLVSLLGLSACGWFTHQGSDAPPHDRDVAAIFLAANNTDISYAQVATYPGRTTNVEVLGFANRMLNDHGGLNRAALDLFSDINLVPRDYWISLDLVDVSAARRDTLRPLTGAVFDSAYINNEIRYHGRFLALLDSLLIPSTKNAAFKTMLTRVRPAVAAHLEHATRIQAGLGK